MSIAFSLRASRGFASTPTWDVLSGVGGTITPNNNSLYLLAITGVTVLSPTPATTTGLTWVQIGNAVDGSDHIWLYRAMKSSGLSNGTITVSWGGGSATGSVLLVEVTGVDTSGTNGSGAVVQSVTGHNFAGPTVSLSMTLSAFANTVANACVGFFGWGNAQVSAPTLGSGFTTIGDTHAETANGVGDTSAEQKIGEDLSVDESGGGSRVAGVALELAVAPRTLAIGQATTETDLAQPMTVVKPGLVNLGQASGIAACMAMPITPALVPGPQFNITQALTLTPEAGADLSLSPDSASGLHLDPFGNPCTN